jgi:asparagine N-glycosylation enzyme membrane subunit Stt3
MFSDGGWMGLVSGILLIGVVFYQSIILIKKDPGKYSLKIFLFMAILASFLLALLDFDWQLPMVFLTFCLYVGLALKSTDTS